MAKDFAVQGYKKDNSKRRVHIVAGILTVIIVSGIYFIKVKHRFSKSPVAQQPKDQIAKIIQKDVEQPRFKFYTMLAETEDKISVDDKEDVVHGKFILRIAEFKYKAEAVKLQRRLQSKNYSTNIGRIEVNKNKFYVVTMGPYPNNIEAKQAKLSLEKNRYKSTIQKLPEK